MKANLNITHGSLELREVKQNKPHYEIVQWIENTEGRKHCYVLAVFDFNEHEHDYSLRFMGSTPFIPEVNKDEFWEIAKMGQEILDRLASRGE